MEMENSEIKSPTYDISKFRLKRILNNNSVRKSISLLGTFPDLSETDEAIVVFEKNAYQESDISTEAASKESPAKPSYFSAELKVNTEFINNIYGSFQVVPSLDLCAVKSTVIYPATDKHVEKYSICQKYLIRETPDLYESTTLPYINESQFSLEWVYNILEHKKETERIVFEDKDPETGFILLPDLKWDGRNVENLYLLGIVHKHDIKSIRDLNGSHLPLLRNIRQSAKDEISKRYGLNPNQLRMYFHYQPSFYHLHVHINPIRNDAPGIWCEKSHMLDTVISNLELLPDYYQRATLPFVLYEGNKLLDLYEEKLTVRSVAAPISESKEREEEPAVESAVDVFSDDDPEERECKRIRLATPDPKEAEATAQVCA
ncbi:m7GpppX diphosphatase [Drosophila guanche]|uniref:m7GpppX diphosphatase n=1 Tax=Drosophila guanche TaxID=7266 RepID=A0A3B0JLG2_DROGU|nr:m7GpppX diphosphatase [Drosophila guanche]SPP83154.1 blast:m7GpppX diphosphatase [Drosophila guanche]